MAVRATSIKHDGQDIKIGPRADVGSLAVAEELYQQCHAGDLECREHDDDPRLTHLKDPVDGRVHGAWVYLQKRNDTWVICHFPFQRSGIKLQNHEVRVMTDQHRWQQDYWARAGQDAGYAADQEVTLPGGNRLDVAITAPDGLTVGIEVQHSTMSLRKIKVRDKKAGTAGVPLVWSADHAHAKLAYQVAHVQTQELPHSRVPRNSWTVTGGPRKMRVERCRPFNFDGCPIPRRRGRHCGGWHPKWEPYPGLTVDRVAELAPIRELLRVDTFTKQGIVMLDATDYHRFVEEFRPVLAGGDTARDDHGTTNPCDYSVDPALVPVPRSPEGSDPESPSLVTVCDRLRSMGLSSDRIAWWLAQEPGSVRVDNVPVTDAMAPAPLSTRIVFRS